MPLLNMGINLKWDTITCEEGLVSRPLYIDYIYKREDMVKVYETMNNCMVKI